MPELPEVDTIVTDLRRRATPSAILSVRLIRRDIVTPYVCDICKKLSARHIAGIYRRGKRIIFVLDTGARFYIHLGMSGRLELAAPDAPVLPHTHLRLLLDCPAAGTSKQAPLDLRFSDPRRFGGIFFVEDCEEGLGPEPLTLTAPEFAARLANTRRPIKSALLDQRLIAGLGNIYVDESLFAARIHPLAPASRLGLSQVVALTRAMKQVLNQAIQHRGSTLRDYRDAQGNEGGFQKLHEVYGREGKPCPRCRTPIRRIILGGRSTHYCPKCQPAPATRRRATPRK